MQLHPRYHGDPYVMHEKRDLNLNKDDLVACVGFPSIILNYNQISTLGGFLNNYQLNLLSLVYKNLKNITEMVVYNNQCPVIL